MFSHFSLGSNDLLRSEAFYSALMPTLGQTLLEVSHDEGYVAFGRPGWRHPQLFIGRPFDGLPATWSHGFHIAFMAKDKEAVHQFYESAINHGGYDDGAPGLRSIYAPDYYAAYVRDPDGNKLQAVCYLEGRKAGPTGDVISHITIGHADLEKARSFYTNVLEPLGLVDIPKEGDASSMCSCPLMAAPQVLAMARMSRFPLQAETPLKAFMRQRSKAAAAPRGHLDQDRIIQPITMGPMCAIWSATNCRRCVENQPDIFVGRDDDRCVPGMFGTKKNQGHADKGPHTRGFLGSFFECGGNQMTWSYHPKSPVLTDL